MGLFGNEYDAKTSIQMACEEGADIDDSNVIVREYYDALEQNVFDYLYETGGIYFDGFNYWLMPDEWNDVWENCDEKVAEDLIHGDYRLVHYNEMVDLATNKCVPLDLFETFTDEELSDDE